MCFMPAILTPTSPGELVDKITILQIKRERFSDSAKLANVQRELDVLTVTAKQSLAPSDRLTDLWAQLKKINEALWDVEDDIRGLRAALYRARAFRLPPQRYPLCPEAPDQ
jgi:hypothetical protein